MPDPPYALALTAGLIAAVNPCGVALLPGYLSLVVLDRTANPAPLARLGRALLTTAAMTAGFVAVFGAFGLVVAPLATSAQRHLPYVTVGIGLVLAGVGGWLMAGRQVRLPVPRPATARAGRSATAMGLYGASYAVASLSCAVGPFLAITTSTLRTQRFGAAMLVFGCFALGMGLAVGALTVATALARDVLVVSRRLLPHVPRVGGALLTFAGLYVAYYGWYEIRLFGGSSAEDPVVSAVITVQAAAQRWLAGIGAGRVGLALATLCAASLTVAVLRRHSGRPAGNPKPGLCDQRHDCQPGGLHPSQHGG